MNELHIKYNLHVKEFDEIKKFVYNLLQNKFCAKSDVNKLKAEIINELSALASSSKRGRPRICYILEKIIIVRRS